MIVCDNFILDNLKVNYMNQRKSYSSVYTQQWQLGLRSLNGYRIFWF